MVLTVPMRNGNKVCRGSYGLFSYCSYRTYEEWKHLFLKNLEFLLNLFLPYLWGMETQPSKLGQKHPRPGSYRTYEEWKRCIPFTISYVASVLTVPMRNGNFFFLRPESMRVSCSYRTYEEWKPNAVWICRKWNWKVLTVPMRNGNYSSLFKSIAWNHVLTVPMRNGNYVPGAEHAGKQF